MQKACFWFFGFSTAAILMQQFCANFPHSQVTRNVDQSLPFITKSQFFYWNHAKKYWQTSSAWHQHLSTSKIKDPQFKDTLREYKMKSKAPKSASSITRVNNQYAQYALCKILWQSKCLRGEMNEHKPQIFCRCLENSENNLPTSGAKNKTNPANQSLHWTCSLHHCIQSICKEKIPQVWDTRTTEI